MRIIHRPPSPRRLASAATGTPECRAPAACRPTWGQSVAIGDLFGRRGAAAWKRARGAPRWLELARYRRVLVLAPHPDDETLGPGGLIALACRGGATVRVVLLSAGECEQPDVPPVVLAATRDAELTAALAALGPVEVARLPGRDRRLTALRRRLVPALADELRAFAPDLVLAPAPGDWHDDHRAACWILRHALEPARLPLRPLCLGYEVWRPLPATHALDITAALDAKRLALAAYAARFRQRRLDLAMLALNLYRGESLGAPPGHSAEAFEELPA
jgi:LmbE family N-acetylglucosaminyl deacetylase